MNPDIKKKWIEDLRSGNFEQGRTNLHSQSARVPGGEQGDKFCCLGVLCEQAVSAGIIPPGQKGTGDEEKYLVLYGADREISGLPEEVRRWAGIRDGLGAFQEKVTEPDGEGPYTVTLASLNDNGVSFNVIANIIEENF
ncbi:MAG: hypothetical protein LC723_07485 [Actinobacteria bacterium]|nr:hypothetical protein [Actinomycetota bacterium]